MIIRLLLLLLVAGQTVSQYTCGQGWLQYQDTCVLLYERTLSFFAAQELCQNKHADLIVVKDQQMNDWLADKIKAYSIKFWIGLLDREEDSSFKWVDGSLLTYSNWQPGEPNNVDGIGEDCVEMYNSGKWNDEQCLAFHYFFCSKGFEIPKCDIENFWESYGGKCYRWITDTKNIYSATSHCSLLDGAVISINNAGEQAFVATMQSRHLNLPYWTGLSDIDQTRGSYIWQDGTNTTSYDNWDFREPDSTTAYPGCALTQQSAQGAGTWSVRDCNDDNMFICEKDEGTCAEGWILHGGQCYQYNAMMRTWFDAKYYCEAEGGWLVTVSDGPENSFIASNMYRLKDENIDSMWIGLSDTGGDGTFQWVHQTLSTYSHWQPGKPQNTINVADCAYMNTADTNGTWYQMQCTLLAGFVCKLKVGSIVTPVVDPIQVGSCETDWAIYGDSCYYTPSKIGSWSEGLAECKAQFPPSSDYASIHSYAEQSFITERLVYANYPIWIGLGDAAQEGVFVWSDGTAYDFQNWDSGEPNDAGGQEDCAYLGNSAHSMGLWNDRSCDRKYRFLCKMPKYQTPPASVTPPPTLAPSDRCGSGWSYDANGNNCYKYVTSATIWTAADDHCHYEGGHLTSVTSSDESDVIVQFSQYYQKNFDMSNVWIGLHDRNMEAGYEWSDGAPFAFLNWHPGEPNDADIGEDCAEMHTANGYWNDLPCDRTVPYICKKNDLITQQFTSYPNARLQTSDGENPVSNLWPEECAFTCYAYGTYCKSFNYRRVTRECTILFIDKDTSSAPLIPAFEDPWDHYQRDWSGPPYAPATTMDPSFGCRKGEFPYRTSCYTLADSLATFRDMQDICALRTSDLVSIADQGEMNFVTSLMQTGNNGAKIISEVWLGLTDMDREASYAWTDGSPVTFTKWASGEPNNIVSDDDCVVQNYNLNGWRDVSCTGSTAYGVCKKPQTTTQVVPPPNEGCPGGWQKYMSSCYQFVNDIKLTWQDAKNTCLQRGGRLTTTTSNYEQAYLASQMGAIVYYTGDYWIGLSDTDTPGTYKWVDGTSPSLSAWGPGQPDDTRFGTCVALIGGLDPSYAGLWMDENCYNAHNYICEKPLAGATDTPYTQPPVTQPSNVGCEEGAIGYGSNCFIVFEKESSFDKLTWSSARTECQKVGADLASFQSKEEEAYLVSQFTPLNPDNLKYGFWMGINDMSLEGGWAWSDGSAVVYVNWGPGEPNDYANSEDCGEMFLSEGRGWDDITCLGTRNWVCKKPKNFELTPTLPPIGVCPSDPDWQFVSPYCYYHSDVIGENDRFSWDAAEAFCMTMGAHLVSIETDVENQLIIAMAPTLATEYWIGLRQQVRTGPYTWSDGTPYTYSNWYPGQPDNHNGEEMCAELWRYDLDIRGQGQYWNDASCGITTAFICKKRDSSIDPITPAPTNPPVGGCSNGYFKYFNGCYRMGGYDTADRYSWQEARTVCEQEGGTLVSIHGKEVQSLMTSMLIDVDVDVWIGFNDLGSAGRYHWTDGKSTTYTNWFPGEPSGIVNPGETPPRDCVELLNEQWYAGMWNDAQCETEIAYICGKDLEPGQEENPPASAFCSDKSYYKYGDSCFKISSTPRTFSEAQDFCASDGALLTSITDGYYEAFVEYLLYSNGVSDAWIGMTSNSDGQYTWLDEWPVHFSKWGGDEPSQRPGEGCVMITDEPAWYDTICTERHATICRTTTAKPPPPVEDVPGFCPPEMSAFGGFCYYVPEDLVHSEWYSARYDCQTKFDGSDLASIHSKAENEFIRSMVYNELGVRTAWLGLERSASGGFQWVDNTPVDFVHWGNDEPSDVWLGTPENCGEMYTNEVGTWNDEDCYEGSTYVCKIAKYQNDTSSEPVTGEGGLSAGAIAGIVIGCVVILIALVLMVGWFMGSRKSSENLPSSMDTSPPSGFDNVVYTSKESKSQVDEKA